MTIRNWYFGKCLVVARLTQNARRRAVRANGSWCQRTGTCTATTTCSKPTRCTRNTRPRMRWRWPPLRTTRWIKQLRCASSTRAGSWITRTRARTGLTTAFSGACGPFMARIGARPTIVGWRKAPTLRISKGFKSGKTKKKGVGSVFGCGWLLAVGNLWTRRHWGDNGNPRFFSRFVWIL